MKESKNLWVGISSPKKGQPNPPWVFDQGPCFPHNFPTDPKKPIRGLRCILHAIGLASRGRDTPAGDAT